MTLIFTIMRYYPYGGLEKSFLNICREALARGHRLDIVCAGWEGEKPEGARIIEVQLASYSNHQRIAELHKAVKTHKRTVENAVTVGFKRMPDLDVYYAGDVCFVNEAANKHGSWYRLTPRYKTMAAMEEAVFSLQSFTRILYISPREKENYQRSWQTPDSRFFALPAGIDKVQIRKALESNAGAALRQSLAVSASQFLLLMVGSDFKRKGVDRSIEALASLSPGLRERTILVVVGEGKTEKFMKLASKFDVSDKVFFLGGRKDVPALLAAADVLLHPARIETAGNAILEGMVAGLPVLVSRSAGFSYHTERAQAGMLIEDNPYLQQGFNAQLDAILSDEPLRKRLSENATRYSDTEDLYRRPQVAMDVIEQVAGEVVNGDVS